MANIDNGKISKKSLVKPLEMSKLGLGGGKNIKPSGQNRNHISNSIGEPLGADSLNVEDKQRVSPQEEGGVANQIRQDKQASRNPKSKKEEKKEEEEDVKETPFNQLKKKARDIKNKFNLKKKLGDKLDQKVFNPAREGTANLLKMSWLNVIDSFGLTLIYINLHVFGRSVLSDKVFCELGEEWLPAKLRSSIDSEEAKKELRKIGFIEKVVLIFADLLVIVALILLLAGAVIIILPFISTWGMTKAIVTTLWGTAWDWLTFAK